MIFTLNLDDDIMIKYAQHLGYTDEEILELAEQETFIHTLEGILDNTCDCVLDCNERHISLK